MSTSAAYDPKSALNRAAEILESCDGNVQTALQDSKLVALLRRLSGERLVMPECVRVIGQSWMALARWTLQLYVPSAPLDPLRVQECRKSILHHQTSWIDKQFSLYRLLEQNETGGSAGLPLYQLEEEKKGLSTDFVSPSRMIHILRDAPLENLRGFWKEVQNFTRDLSVAGIYDEIYLDQNGLSVREEMTQKSISNFIDRLRQVYPSYHDLLPAVELSFHQIRLGLRLVRQSSWLLQHGKVRQVQLVSESMGVLYPLKVNMGNEATLLANGQFNIANALLFKLAIQANNLVKGRVVASTMNSIQTIYDHLADIWNKDVSRNEEAQKQAESLYKNKSSSEDDAAFVKELQALFPSFQEEHEHPLTSDGSEEKPNDRIVDDEVALNVFRVHMSLFGAQTDPDTFMKLLPSLRCKLMEAWLGSDPSIFSDQLDNVTLGFRLDLLRKHTDSLTPAIERDVPAGALDFYRGADFFEVRRATDIVKDLKGAVHHLSLAWPEQLVLQHSWNIATNSCPTKATAHWHRSSVPYSSYYLTRTTGKRTQIRRIH